MDRLRTASIRLAFAAALSLALPAFGSEPDLDRLQAEIGRIAGGAGGTVGVGVRHIESGRELYLNLGVRFPMGSVFKLPLAVQLLSLVDKGTVDLEKTVVLQPSDLRAGSGRLAKGYGDPRAISLRELLETMMIDSDNTATDILWKEAGGSKAVMARLNQLGIRGISVDRPTGQLLAAAAGIGPLPPDADLTPAGFQELLRKNPRAKRAAGIAAFLKDGRDTATPEALVALLLKIWRGDALNPTRTALLIDIMYRCDTGKRRLRGMLPPWTKVAHKTGTLRPSVVNDAGIISLPDRAGHVVVAVLIKESVKDLAAQEHAIAEIASAIHDYFASNPGRTN